MTTTTNPQHSAARPKRSRHNAADHRFLKLVLTAGAFLTTWLGSGWLARQDAATAQAVQPSAVTVAHVAPDGTVTERMLQLEPIPQVVVTSRSSR